MYYVVFSEKLESFSVPIKCTNLLDVYLNGRTFIAGIENDFDGNYSVQVFSCLFCSGKTVVNSTNPNIKDI